MTELRMKRVWEGSRDLREKAKQERRRGRQGDELRQQVV